MGGGAVASMLSEERRKEPPASFRRAAASARLRPQTSRPTRQGGTMSEVSVRTLFGAAAVAFMLTAAAGPIVAQPPEPSPPPVEEPVVEEPAAEEEEEAVTVLEEITVTAQKRGEENIQLVPIAMSTFDAEELEALTIGGADVKFLSARVPSLLLESSFGRAFPRFYIRGLGNTDFDLNA